MNLNIQVAYAAAAAAVVLYVYRDTYDALATPPSFVVVDIDAVAVAAQQSQ